MEKGNRRERLVLLDSHAVLHRAYHALPDFATSTGVPTGALYGFVAMILKIVAELQPDYIIAAYDLPKPTYRHEVYENYKSGRAKTDDDLIMQIEKSKDVCRALSIPVYANEGFEADDVLGTIVEKLKSQDVDIVIASGDMDTMQLIDEKKVQVYTLKKGINDTILYDEEKIRERYGFGPEMIPSYKGLRGDPSDNIIGVEGIGEKTATELIKNFGNIENLYRVLKIGNSKVKEKIKPRIIELLKDKEEEARFSELLATIRRDVPLDFKLPEKKWQKSVDMEEAKKVFQELQFRNMTERLQNALGKNGSEISEKAPASRVADNIDKEVLEETKVALWVVDSNKTNPTLSEILDFANTEDFNTAKETIWKELTKRESLEVFTTIEKPLIPIINKMEKHGVLIDRKSLSDLGSKYTKELKAIESKIWQMAGEEFNVASPKQLGTILFDKLGLAVKNQKKTAGGAKSTKESELIKLQGLHPIIALILEYRELSKLLSTYIEPIPKMLDEGSRLHAHFIQTGAATGRMASENPNLQNIPVGSERGKVIRHAFISPQNRVLLAFDYSQIELRIAAILSHDKKLIEIFEQNKDVHSAVASQVFGVPEKDVDKEMRRRAKVINFGILYGMGVSALQQNLGTDRKSAQNFLNAYFENFSGLASYIEKVKAEAHQNGYTKTMFGRRRYFEGIKSKLPFIRASAERMAVNAPIQGTQADIIKIAMREIDEYLEKEKLSDKVNLILQIHDELIYEADEKVSKKVIPEIKRIMESVLTEKQSLGVPIRANGSIGRNWGNMEPA